MERQEEKTKFRYFSNIFEILDLVPINDQGILFLLLPDGKIAISSERVFDTGDKVGRMLIDLRRKRLLEEYVRYCQDRHGEQNTEAKVSELVKTKDGWSIKIEKGETTMNLTEYFSDADERGKKQKEDLELLLGTWEEMPIGTCTVCVVNSGKVEMVEIPQDVKKYFDDYQASAMKSAQDNDEAYVLIKTNGKSFLTVGSSFEEWTRAFKLLGNDVFVLEKQDGH
jgi:hypothetical protein